VRLEIDYPRIKSESMKAEIDDRILEDLDSRIIPCHPEAPWIKRCSFGIKFTDEIQYIDEEDNKLFQNTNQFTSSFNSTMKDKEQELEEEEEEEERPHKRHTHNKQKAHNSKTKQKEEELNISEEEGNLSIVKFNSEKILTKLQF
jgi:hypothetical protein